MQYKTTCSHCGKDYLVNGQPGETVHAICPYCGTKANVLTPYDGNNANPTGVQSTAMRPKRDKKEKPLYMKVTMWFLIAVTILFVIFAILYFVFTAMSK